MTVAATLLDGRYVLDDEIGVGGFCEVWRATDNVLTRPVAVKLLHPGYAHQPEARARFRAEARLAGALSHENIARVYDYGEPARGQSYLVMELIGGLPWPGCWPEVPSMPCGPWTSSRRPRPACRPHTARGSFIAISSRRTSCLRPMAPCGSRTSASRTRSARLRLRPPGW